MQTIKLATIDELIELLNSHKVNKQTWGANGAKTVRHLWKEIGQGECTLTHNHALQLIRVINLVTIRVLSSMAGAEAENSLILTEALQIFRPSCAIRKRMFEPSLFEKCRHGEGAPLSTVHRALREELGFLHDQIDTIKITQLSEVPTKRLSKSDSFPGLTTAYNEVKFEAVLSHTLFKQEGYVEVQPDKVTIYVWKPLNPTKHLKRKNGHGEGF